MSLISENVSIAAQARVLESQKLFAQEILQGQAHVYLVHAVYDYTVNGGAIGTLSLPLSDTIPAGGIYVGMSVEKLGAFTSGGAATIALQLNAQQLLNPTPVAFNASPFIGAPVTFNNSKVVKIAAPVTTLGLSVAGATVTAGKYLFGLQYIL
jgi:hypothetical protein